ncbi:hypothetical protein ACE1CI_19530 [Aerosakkonemataceae cyanobacterium BLCC-F50]|uniref:Uncharacterized protein n=1 Tax=Floridaenema flaviceps BLCC-F50 TaxID=3153642 RepID=A0ABV4XTQ0_9CYAN
MIITSRTEEATNLYFVEAVNLLCDSGNSAIALNQVDDTPHSDMSNLSHLRSNQT